MEKNIIFVKKVIIVGGSGFIGRNLARKLLESRYDVIITTRNPKKIKRNFKFITWNPEKENFPAEKVYAIINLAGENIFKKWNEKNKEKFRNSRIITTRKIVSSFKIFKPKVFISASSIAIYGKGFSAKLCKDWEKEALKARKFSTRTIILRLGLVLGKDGGFLKIIKKWVFVFKVNNLNVPIYYIKIEDLCNFVLRALKDNKISGIYNSFYPKPVKYQNLISSIKGIKISVPKFLIKVFLGKDFLENVIGSDNLKINHKLPFIKQP